VRGLDLKGQQSLERDVSIELSPGSNRVQVVVVNDKGVESAETFSVAYDGAAPQPQLYILAIGVSKYLDARYDLTYAAKDAADRVALLEQRAKQREEIVALNPDAGKAAEPREAPKSFYQVHSLKLLDADATRDKILKAREFLRQAKPEDEVIVFFAGHGLLDEKLDYYFGASDINFARPSERGLSYEDIESLLDGVPARRKLVLMDSCHSGEVDKDGELQGAPASDSEKGKTDPVKQRAFPRADIVGGATSRVGLSNSFTLLQELFTDLRRGSGAAVISAASGVEFAYEAPEWNNGVFTFATLEGLKSGSADRNRDGVVTVSELRDYVTEKVQQLTQGKQRPTARRENLDNDFRVF
jgi:uncharacterized caspase-like protein